VEARVRAAGFSSVMVLDERSSRVILGQAFFWRDVEGMAKDEELMARVRLLEQSLCFNASTSASPSPILHRKTMQVV